MDKKQEKLKTVKAGKATKVAPKAEESKVSKKPMASKLTTKEKATTNKMADSGVQTSTSMLGHFVVSKCGRDEGRAYVVVRIVDGDFVMVSDGKVRKLDNPKKKRKKHLRQGPLVETIARKLILQTKIFDSELHSALGAVANTLDPDMRVVE